MYYNSNQSSIPCYLVSSLIFARYKDPHLLQPITCPIATRDTRKCPPIQNATRLRTAQNPLSIHLRCCSFFRLSPRTKLSPRILAMSAGHAYAVIRCPKKRRAEAEGEEMEYERSKGWLELPVASSPLLQLLGRSISRVPHSSTNRRHTHILNIEYLA